MTTECVNWPKGWKDSGEGGLVVYFAVLDDEDDSFVKCFAESTITMSYPDVEVSGHLSRVWSEPPSRRRSGDDHLLLEFPGSLPLLAAICVDSTKSSWCRDGDYFTPTRNDLTDHGRALYDNLTALYGREVLILTLLDT